MLGRPLEDIMNNADSKISEIESNNDEDNTNVQDDHSDAGEGSDDWLDVM